MPFLYDLVMLTKDSTGVTRELLPGPSFFPIISREGTMPKDWKKPDRFWKESKEEKNEAPPPEVKKKKKPKLKLSIPSKKKGG